MDLSLLKREQVANAGTPAQLGFRFPRGRGIATGLEALTQVCIINLLTDTYTVAAKPSMGGNLTRTIFSIGLGPNNLDRIATTLQAGIRKSESEIVEDQARYSLPEDEQLLEMTLSGVEFKDEISISVTITNVAGETVTITL